MFTAEYNGINSFLVGASSLLLEKGVKRETRNQTCYELPGPFIFKIKNPTARYITIAERKWSPILPFAESLWLASGQNDLEFIVHYLKRMQDFSDDGSFLRGAYGPRLRKYNGIFDDYRVDGSQNVKLDFSNFSAVDQFQFIISCFKKDLYTRQAIITIGDPPKDCFDLNGDIKITKDFPCTQLLQFQKQPDCPKLNLTVYMRSNDIMWGASAVNIFNFTLMLEYFAQMLSLQVGDYYHIANNFHYYEKHRNNLISFSKIDTPNDFGFNYSKSFFTLAEFDEKIAALQVEEKKLRLGQYGDVYNFEDELFDDWYKAFYVFNTKKIVSFANPILNNLFRRYFT